MPTHEGVVPLTRGVGRFAAGLMLCLVLATCSVTQYEQPIKDFSAATTSADKALRSYSQIVVKEVTDVRRAEAAARPVAVQIARGDCLGDSQRCRIVILRERNEPNPRLLVPEQPIPTILVLMDEIRKYANGLEAILTADTASKVEQSVDSVNGSLVNLAELVESDTKTFESFATPAGEAVKWLFGIYIDSVKLGALRTATRNADPLIAEAEPIFAEAMKQANNATRDSLAETVSKRHDAYREAKSDATLTSLLQAAQTYDAVLTAAPESIFPRFRAAHADLTKALNTEEITWDQAFAALESLQADADRLGKIVEDLLAAAEKAENEGS
jgi:hypothetical protein